MDPRGLAVTPNAYNSPSKHKTQFLLRKFCDTPAGIEVSFQTDVEVLILILIGLFMGTLHLEEDGEAEIFRKLASHLLKFEDTLPPLMMMYHQFHKTMKYCDLEFLLVTFSK